MKNSIQAPHSTSDNGHDGQSLPAELRDWEARGEYLPVGPAGARIYVQSIGTAAPPEQTLLMFHGYPESSYSYHANVAALAERFARVVLFDFLGFGLSDKPQSYSYSLFEQADLALLVWRALGVRGGHLLAHDMGDSVATELLCRSERGLLPGWFQDGFLSLTFTDGNMVMQKAKLRIGQSLLRLPWLGAAISRRSSFEAFAQQIQSASGAGLGQRDVELLWAALRHKDGQRIQYRLIKYLDERDRFQDSRWLPALSTTRIPIHLCWGKRDQVAPPQVAEHLVTHVCPRAKLTLLPDAGHFCQQEAPEAWNRAVLGFWARNM